MIIDRFTGRPADSLKRDEQALAEVLREAGGDVKGRTVRCPFCDDHRPSAGIYSPNGDGGLRYKCQACGFNGSILDVIAKADGLEIAEIFKRLRGDSRPQQPPKVYPDIEALKTIMPYPVEAVYCYTHPTTNQLDMLVLRLRLPDGDKTFRQAMPVSGGFVQKGPPKPWPLYNRERIQAADTVVVVEGEKCVHALHEYGITATTSPGGALKAEYADWTPLAGKNVILWPDPDEQGRVHVTQIEAILQGLEPQPRIALIEPADLNLKGKEDAVDFIEQLKTLHTDKGDISTALLEALNSAKPRGIACGVSELIEDTIAGRRVAVKWPWSCVGGLTKALLPGTVTILCGNVGASKSFMLLEAGAYWQESGVKTAIFELEEDRDFHLTRCLAQKSRTADVTDPDWIRDNPEQARALFTENKAFLESFGACIYATPDTQPTLDQLAGWIQIRAKAGCRIIAIDPITAAAHKGRSVWEEDNTFLQSVKRTAVDYHCSIVLITHPIKSVSLADVTQLAGGAAYQRFAQTILWLESHADKTSKVKMSCGTTEAEYNRTIHILKARNGKGQGVRLACNFQVESLTLSEIGIIIRSKNK